MRALTEKTEIEFSELIHSDWLLSEHKVTDPDQLAKRESLQFLRYIYIPEIVLWLHRILYETRDLFPENLEKSVALSIVVANKNNIWMELKISKKLELLCK